MRFEPELCYGRHRGPAAPDARAASVVILLYLHRGEVHFPLTARPPHLPSHAGQISLPGGAREAGESAEVCALRELNEELGVETAQVEVLRKLSPIFVFASNYFVEPFVAAIHDRPVFCPDPAEVEKFYEVPLGCLQNIGRVETHKIHRFGTSFRAPHIGFAGQRIWGATSIILDEFSRVL